MHIGLDIMGGDFAPQATLSGALLAVDAIPASCRLVLFGDSALISTGLKDLGASLDNFDIVHCSEAITMSEHPAKAFTQKPDSSISIGFQYLKENNASVAKFVRYAVGEGIEKREENFAEEVAKQIGK